jgi:hypothetical protein
MILISANLHPEPYPVYPIGISYLNSYLAFQMLYLEIFIIDSMTYTNEGLTHRITIANNIYLYSPMGIDNPNQT